MDLTQKSIQEIERLVTAAEPIQTIEKHGNVYARANDALMCVVERPKVNQITTHSLDSLCEFINRNLNSNAISKSPTRRIVHVESPMNVKLYAEANIDDAKMDILASASALTSSFGSFMYVSEFISLLNTGFQQNEDRDALIELASNVRKLDSDEVIIEDNGISSTVQYTKKSGSIAGKTKFVNPAVLKPYSTFSEIEDQPEREFIYRMDGNDGNMRVSLNQVESYKWQLDTMAKIKEYIKEKINKSDMVEIERPDENGNMVKEKVENGKLVDRGIVVIL